MQAARVFETCESRRDQCESPSHTHRERGCANSECSGCIGKNEFVKSPQFQLRPGIPTDSSSSLTSNRIVSIW